MMKTSTQEKLLQNSIAMTVALVSFGMLFATLFLGYFLVRFNSPMWPPVEIQGMPKLLPLMSTLVMVFSSLTYFLVEKKALQDERSGKIFWTLTFILGMSFLILQWNLWATLKASGILVSNGMVPSMVYAFTWLHAAHIVVALLGVIWLGFYLFFQREELTDVKIINVGKFWHFLGILWVILYLMIFVL
jgi:cytochrome c oxidase subunit 3